MLSNKKKFDFQGKTKYPLLIKSPTESYSFWQAAAVKFCHQK
jgi:hypothetical protein